MNVHKRKITPALASEWLQKNVRNRPVTMSRVNSYASQIRLGRWKLTGETIKFAETGELIDGQHRLMAVVAANMPIESYVAEGLTPDVFDCLDRGNTRSLAHAFGRERKKNYTALAACVRMLWQLEQGIGIHSGGKQIQIEDGWEVLSRHPAAEAMVELASKLLSTSPLSRSVLATFLTWTYERHGDRAIEFWTRVATGEDLKGGSPEYILRRKLEYARRSQADFIHRDAEAAYCVKAFNAYITGKKLGVLRFYLGQEEMPKFV